MLKQYALLFLPYAKKTTIVISALFTKKSLVLLPFLTIPLFDPTFYYVVVFLIGLVFFDFATGVGVSYKNKKEEENKARLISKEKYLKLKNTDLITSDKLKKNGIKIMLYVSSGLVGFCIDEIMKIKQFHFDFSEVDFTVTISILSWWIVVEIYSIFFENFKGLGYDVFKMFTKMKEVYVQFKKAKNETSHN